MRGVTEPANGIVQSKRVPLVLLTARRAEAHLGGLICNIINRGPERSQTHTVMVQAYTVWGGFGKQAADCLSVNLRERGSYTRLDGLPAGYGLAPAFPTVSVQFWSREVIRCA